MFFNAFFLTVPLKFKIDTSVLYKMKADFLGFNLVTKSIGTIYEMLVIKG